MKGDFSRFTFDAKKHYTRVLMQQGRPQLDADSNEQAAILLHRLETLAADIIGPFGGPKDDCAFDISITAGKDDFIISKGRYYVGGMLCENEHETTYFKQPLALHREAKFKAGTTYVVYLDAWEQYINPIEDPDIIEKALGGADTAGRAKVVWRVIAREFDPLRDVESVKQAVAGGPGKFLCKTLRDNWNDVLHFLHPPNRGLLSVRAEQSDPRNQTPCITSPTARYRGAENQLYRVEVHSGGPGSGSLVKRSSTGDVESNLATFKWSRENGSVVFPVATISGSSVALARLSGDATLGLKIGDWVELVDEAHHPHGRPATLMQVEDLKQPELLVTLKPAPPSSVSPKHAYLRRWDQKPGAENKGGLTLRDGEAVILEGRWLDLEDGIQIQFEPASSGANSYRPGDYWYIPMRTVDDGKIEWPRPIEPYGINHRYAPIAILNFTNTGFEPAASCVMRFDPQSHFGKG